MSMPDHQPAPNSAFELSHVQRDKAYKVFRDMGLISFGVVVGPLIIFFFWWLISNSLKGRKSRQHVFRGKQAPYHRKRYNQTWRGWMQAEASPDDATKKSRSWIAKQILMGSTSRADFNKIWWDPTASQVQGDAVTGLVSPDGPNAEISTHPSWLRWFRGSKDMAAKMTADLESGLLASGRRVSIIARRHLSACQYPTKSSHRSTERPEYLMSGALPVEDVSTVRKAKKSSAPANPWLYNGSATIRATQVQLLRSEKPVRRRALQRSITLPPSLDGKGIFNATIPRSTSLSQMLAKRFQETRSELLKKRRRAFNLTPVGDQSESSNAELCGLFTPPWAYPHGKTRPPSPVGPHVSEADATPRGFTPIDGLGIRRTRDKTSYIDGAANPDGQSQFVDCLERSLEFWTSPMLVEPFSRVHGGGTGRAGPPSSPAMGWMSVQDRPDDMYEDLSRYEDEMSAGQPTRTSSSPVVEMPEQTDNNSRQDHVVSMDGQGQGHQSNPTGVEVTRPRWYTPHREQATCPTCRTTRLHSMSTQPPSETCTKPDRTVFPALPRMQTYHMNTVLPGGRVNSRPLNTSEKTFLREMDRKLTWLQFELSPGFRGPEDNPAESFVNAQGLTSNAVTRATGLEDARDESGQSQTGSTTQNRRPKILDTPKLDEWRIAVNGLRRLSRDEKDSPQRAIAHYEDDPHRGIGSGDIDTAAWILRRRPQGYSEANTHNSPAPLRATRAEKHNDWEKRRRPKVIRRMTLEMQERSRRRVRSGMVRSKSTSALPHIAEV
ncbi:MAG: hypothetical protein M1833_003542 [Piccolia ochrophora]|nr:MAG: hypothetical protein M1833_003542 [Piccolia ochrophora]